MVNVPWCHKHDEPETACPKCAEEIEEFKRKKENPPYVRDENGDIKPITPESKLESDGES